MFAACVLIIISLGTSWSMDRGRPFVETNPSPKILICTPTYLTKFLKGPKILDETLFKSIKHIVLDEVKSFLFEQ